MNPAENQLSEGEKILPLKILVADDDMLNRQMMQLLLVHEGHQVDVVANGLEAFDAVKFRKFDMVLMDLHMPVMDGIEATFLVDGLFQLFIGRVRQRNKVRLPGRLRCNVALDQLELFFKGRARLSVFTRAT